MFLATSTLEPSHEEDKATPSFDSKQRLPAPNLVIHVSRDEAFLLAALCTWIGLD